MKSFRTELENSIVEKDIIELEKKINLFNNEDLDGDSFRSLRLARGIYGQRQQGVQMVRIKFPLGIINPAQLKRVAQVSDEYSDGNVHITTRQDIQIHHVSLDDTPQLWSELEKDKITIREACGNTVRNITASPYAGIDKEEPFDITKAGWSLFEFFLRNPIGQDLGRKFKIALSSSFKDDARTYIHDLGLIPKIVNEQEGFSVYLGGGLGAQPSTALLIKEFLLKEELLRYAEAILIVFDKCGERNKRNKARFKYLIKQNGIDEIVEKIEIEFQKSLRVHYDWKSKSDYSNSLESIKPELIENQKHFAEWDESNVKEQKQRDYYSILIKVRNGNLNTGQVRILADIIQKYSEDEARLTIDQNLLIRFVPSKYIGNVYNALFKIGLVDVGADSITDITSCPGSKTCNLAITSTYDVSNEIEKFLFDNYPSLVKSKDLKIKISGCMNSCGQHSVADIGFHGSSIRHKDLVFPALQVLLGAYNLEEGKTNFGDKVIKIPTKRVLKALQEILENFITNKLTEERFSTFYQRKGKPYFYDLLKKFGELDNYSKDEILDWGSEDKFQPQIGIGECAGVKIDLVQTLLFEANEKLAKANEFLSRNKLKDALYESYSSIIESSKAFLLKEGLKTNSKNQIQAAFEPYYPLLKKELPFHDFNELIDTYSNYNVEQMEVEKSIAYAFIFHSQIKKLI